jgi:hypothetical protein
MFIMNHFDTVLGLELTWGCFTHDQVGKSPNPRPLFIYLGIRERKTHQVEESISYKKL